MTRTKKKCKETLIKRGKNITERKAKAQTVKNPQILPRTLQWFLKNWFFPRQTKQKIWTKSRDTKKKEHFSSQTQSQQRALHRKAASPYNSRQFVKALKTEHDLPSLQEALTNYTGKDDSLLAKLEKSGRRYFNCLISISNKCQEQELRKDLDVQLTAYARVKMIALAANQVLIVAHEEVKFLREAHTIIPRAPI